MRVFQYSQTSGISMRTVRIFDHIFLWHTITLQLLFIISPHLRLSWTKVSIQCWFFQLLEQFAPLR
jgi:hypothetical protein